MNSHPHARQLLEDTVTATSSQIKIGSLMSDVIKACLYFRLDSTVQHAVTVSQQFQDAA